MDKNYCYECKHYKSIEGARYGGECLRLSLESDSGYGNVAFLHKDQRICPKVLVRNEFGCNLFEK